MLANPSQLIIRNIAELGQGDVLVVSTETDQLVAEIAQEGSSRSVESFTYLFSVHNYNQQAGLTHHFGHVLETQQTYDTIVLSHPKEKVLFEYLVKHLSHFLNPEGKFLVVGENKGGIKTASKRMESWGFHCQKVDSARHCTLISAHLETEPSAFNLDDWRKEISLTVNNLSMTIVSLPGVFSHGELDQGTELLLSTFRKPQKGRILDFGCGAGVIGCYLAMRSSSARVEMIDVNAFALEASRQTLKANGADAQVIASDGLQNVKGLFDFVVSNPPFHAGKQTHYETTENFLKTIKKHMQKRAAMRIVANSFLKYVPIMETHLGPVKTLTQNSRFKIYSAYND